MHRRRFKKASIVSGDTAEASSRWRRRLGLRIVDITAQLNGALDCAAAGGVDFTLKFTRDHLGAG